MSGRLASAVAMAGLVVWLGAGAALADGTYHTSQYAFGALDGTSIRSGFVENIHANGPDVYAHEQYVLNGGEPGTTARVPRSTWPEGPTVAAGSVRRRAGGPSGLSTSWSRSGRTGAPYTSAMGADPGPEA